MPTLIAVNVAYQVHTPLVRQFVVEAVSLHNALMRDMCVKPLKNEEGYSNQKNGCYVSYNLMLTIFISCYLNEKYREYRYRTLSAKMEPHDRRRL